MSLEAKAAHSPMVYAGEVKVPGTDGPARLSLGVDLGAGSVSVDLAQPEAGESRWAGSSVTVRRLLKYDEVHFITEGLPIEGVELQWKANLSRLDGSAAGVIIVRPNEHRVSGEAGFILNIEKAGR